MKTYTAEVTRSGKWWAIVVPELPGVFSQSRRLDQVEAMTRDAISLWFDEPEKTFDVVTKIAGLPADIEKVVALAVTARARRDEANRAVATAAEYLVKKMNLPYRDAGELLGISHQRVGQLIDR